MKNVIAALAGCLMMSACADIYLSQNIKNVEEKHGSLDSFQDTQSLGVNQAVELAMALSSAYAKAAQQTTMTQHIGVTALIGAAGATALGAANEATNAVLAKRVTAGVATERFLRRGASRAAIVNLYDGASRMNCVALSARVYRLVPEEALEEMDASDQAIREDFAAFLMVLVMREIEFRTYAELAIDLESFGTLVSAFTDVIDDVVTAEPAGEGVQTQRVGGGVPPENPRLVLLEDQALKEFFMVLKGCLEAPAAKASVSPNLGSQGA